MHKLLERQLRRAFGPAAPPGLDAFLRSVDEAYRSADTDRAMVERSLELMSKELFERNQQLLKDIEAQRQIEEALRRREEDFLTLIQHVPMAIMVCRQERLVFVNRACLQAVGHHDDAALIGARTLELMHPDDRSAMALAEQQRFDGPIEVRMRRRDGEWSTMEISLARVMSFRGEPALLVAAQDVTEKRKLQRQVAISDRMASVGTLAAGVAHELNNPLAYVLANLEFAIEGCGELAPALALDGAARLAEMREVLEEAIVGSHRMKEIVHGMKLFSRVDSDASAEVDLVSVLDSSINLVQNELRHRAQLVKDYSAAPRVSGNAGRLGQVVVNLLVNAAQAIPEGDAQRHRVTVSLRAENETARLRISDTGCGMSAEVMRRVFDPFFTTKPVGVGTGLGLSICHGIITGHGGDIQVESTPGQGTTFTITLPLMAKKTAAEATVASALPAPPRKRVLVVDDDVLVAKSIQRALRGHEVVVVNSAKDALPLLRSSMPFDLVLCDLMMPDMTGMELHALVATTWPQFLDRFVFLTGGAFTPSAKAFLEAVPNQTLNKPFDTSQLRALLGAGGVAHRAATLAQAR